MKATIAEVAQQMTKADVYMVLKAIKDMICLAMRPAMDKIEEAPGELMSLEDIPSRTDMVAEAEEETLLMENQRQLLVELFDNLEVVHEHTARSCSVLAALSKTLSTAQLKTVLQASVRPLVQLNALGGLFNPPLARPQRAELPDEVNERV